MCLAVPMEIIELDGFEARCCAKGVDRKVSLLLLQHTLPSVGDWVLVNLGYAHGVVSADLARETWDLLDQLVTEGQPLA